MLTPPPGPTDNLRALLAQSQALQPPTPPPGPSPIVRLATLLGLVAGVAMMIAGLFVFSLSVMVGGGLLVGGAILGTVCYVARENGNDDREKYRRWEMRQRGDALLAFGRERSPQTALIDALKEIELAKMNLQANQASLQSTQNHQYRTGKMDTDAQLETTRLTTEAQTTQARIQAEAQVQAAKYQAMGQAGKMQWDKEMVEFEHDLRAAEAEKDRKLAIDQMLTKMDADIKVLEARMAFESPDAHRRSEQEMITLRAKLTQLQEINKLRDTDPVAHRQLFEQFRRGWQV